MSDRREFITLIGGAAATRAAAASDVRPFKGWLAQGRIVRRASVVFADYSTSRKPIRCPARLRLSRRSRWRLRQSHKRHSRWP